MSRLIINHFITLLLCLALPNLILGNGDGEVGALQKKLSTLSDNIEKVDVLNELGKRTLVEKYELAGTYNEAALAIAEQINYQKGIGEAKRNLSLAALKAGEKDKAIELLNHALEIAEQNKYEVLKASTLWSLGYYWYRLADYPKSIEYLLASKKLCTTLKNDYWLTKCYIQLGWSYFEDNNTDKSEFFFKQGVFQGEKDKYILPEALYGIANFYLYYKINFYQVSIYLNRGIKIAKENDQPRHLAQLQTTTGNFYRHLDQNEKAKEYYLKALKYFEANNFYFNILALYCELGEIAIEEDAYDIALGYYNIVLSFLDKVNNPDIHADVYSHMGTIYYKRDQDYQKTLELYRKALEIVNTGGSLFAKKEIELAIGAIYLKLEQYKKAKNWCKKGMKDAEDFLIFMKEGCQCLATAYHELGQTKQALKYYGQLNILKDSLHKEELAMQLNTLEIREDYEKGLLC